MTFQKSVLSVAVVLLIICLIMIGIAMRNNKYDSDFPPVVADCPDYWIEKPSSMPDETQCYNVKNLGRSECEKSKDFSGSLWSGTEGTCNKYKWATSCDLTWDGVTNKTDPCNKDTGSNS
jgi:hypothetical protein